MNFIEDYNDKIFELREQKLNYLEISKRLEKQGIIMPPIMVKDRCRVIYENRNIAEPQDKIDQKTQQFIDKKIVELIKQDKDFDTISRELAKIGYFYEPNEIRKMYKEHKSSKETKQKICDEIVRLRQKAGLSFNEIQEQLERKGIYKSAYQITQIYYSECKKRNINEPVKRGRYRKSIEITEKELIKLIKSGMDYEDISEYLFKQKEIKISPSAVGARCRKLYEDGKVNKPQKKRKYVLSISNQEIFELREKGYSYELIAQYFREERKINVTKETIHRRCKTIYEEKGKEEPKAIIPKKQKSKVEILMEQVSSEEIYNMRKQGYSQAKIASYYQEKGIEISDVEIGKICNIIFKEKNEKQPRAVRRDHTIEIPSDELFKLREQKLTYKQISEYFTRKGQPVSLCTIENKCKILYEKLGKKEPTMLDDISNEEIYFLKQQGLTFSAIGRYYRNKGVSVSDQTISFRYKKIIADAKQVEALDAKLSGLLAKKINTEKLLQQLTAELINIKNQMNDKNKEINGR